MTNWEKPRLWSGQRLRSKSSGKKSMILSAKKDREMRRKVLPGYPVESFVMSKNELNNYLTGDSITCLLCGKKYRTLGGPHLQKIHGLTEDQYRERYGIPYLQGLSCGDLLKVRRDQGKEKIKYLKRNNDAPRRKQRVSAAARSARKENIKIAKKSTKPTKKFGPRKLFHSQILDILNNDAPDCEIARQYGMSIAWVWGLRRGRILPQYGGTKVKVRSPALLERTEKGTFKKRN